jgi:LCP family protein required for cell wall assembly
LGQVFQLIFSTEKRHSTTILRFNAAMTKPLVCLTLILLLVSLACGLPYSTTLRPTPEAVSQVVSQLLVTAGPNSTATSTPFQPIGPTATDLPTATALPTNTPEPTSVEAPDVPTPIRVDQNLPEGVVNLLVLGNDFRPSAGFRTDIILLVSINTGTGSVSIVSFPRDLYVDIPGWGTNRINTAFPHGGFSMMADTLQYNFGVRPTYYVMTNFQGFVGIVNSLGGINVNVSTYLRDKCDLPQAVNTYCEVGPGTVAMDGATALWYVRSRHSSSDFERGRRAQEVLYAIFTKLMSLDAITRLPELYSAYQSSVETNLSLDVIPPLLPVASQVMGDASRIHRYTIGPGQVTPFTTSGGAQVLLPNYNAIMAIINEAVYH